jgi:ribosomal protein L29
MAKKTTTIKEGGDTQAQITELREKLRVIRFALVGSKPKNVKEEKMIRRDIARLETIKSATK